MEDNLITFPKSNTDDWLVTGMVRKHQGTLISGLSDSFKSFTALDIAMSVATGKSFTARTSKTRKRACALLLVPTLQKDRTFRRIEAWGKKHGSPNDEPNIYVIPCDIKADIDDHIDELISLYETSVADLIVTPHLSHFISSFDEPTQRRWISNMQRLAKKNSAAFLSTHQISSNTDGFLQTIRKPYHIEYFATKTGDLSATLVPMKTKYGCTKILHQTFVRSMTSLAPTKVA